MPALAPHPAAGLVPSRQQVILPSPNNAGTPNALDAEILLSLSGGKQVRTFPLPDGRFFFHNVPTGKHYLDVELVGLVYSTVEIAVEQSGDIGALLTDVINKPAVAYPLLLRPAGRIEFFDKVQPFNIMSFIKTPYGLMILFMVFSLVILPKMRLDPEELKRSEEDIEAEETAAAAAAAPAPSPRQLQQRRKDR